MSFRASVSFASLVLAAICPAQVPSEGDPVITYSTPAVRASTVIDKLSQIAHKRLRVTAPLDQEPLILRLNVVRLSDAMDWIASALDAKWID